MKMVPLGEVVRFTNGGTPPRSRSEFWEGHIPWITGADITEEGAVSARSFISDAAVSRSSTQVLPGGTVLLLTRTSVGKVGVLPQPMAINQDITGISPTDEVNTRYLVHFLRASRPKLVRSMRGATIQGVTRQDVASLEFPLTSVSEQRRIAAILDKADSLRTKRRQVLAHLDTLSQSIFNDMFAGEHQSASLGDLISSGPTNGLYRPEKDYGFGTPILRIDSFHGGEIHAKPLRRVAISSDLIGTYSLRPGDIVVNRVNSMSHLGKSALVRSLDEETVFESNMMRLRVDSGSVLPEYVHGWLQTHESKAQILAKAKQAINQASINQTDVKSLILPLPPLSAQAEYASVVHKIREQSHLSSRGHLEALVRSLQSRAFKGEL